MKSALLLLTIIFMMVGSVSSKAQEVNYPDSFNEPIPLFGEDVIGSRTYPISSQNKMAQAYFNQGMQLRAILDMRCSYSGNSKLSHVNYLKETLANGHVSSI